MSKHPTNHSPQPTPSWDPSPLRRLRAIAASKPESQSWTDLFVKSWLTKEFAALLLAEAFDLDRPPKLTALDSALVDGDLHGLHCDKLFLAVFTLADGRVVRVYIAFEAKAGQAPHVVLQVYGYKLAIWRIRPGQRPNGRRRGAGKPLRTVGVVLYFGPGEFTGALSLREYLDEAGADCPLASGLADFDRLRLINIGKLLGRGRPRDRVLETCCRITHDLVCAPADEAVARRSLQRWAALGLPDCALRDSGWAFILNAFRGGQQALSRAVAAAIDDTGDTHLMNIMQALEANGFDKGEASGFTKAKAAIFAQQMRLKFGELPPERAAQVEEASAEDLDRWLNTLIMADTLDGVFGDRR